MFVVWRVAVACEVKNKAVLKVFCIAQRACMLTAICMQIPSFVLCLKVVGTPFFPGQGKPNGTPTMLGGSKCHVLCCCDRLKVG